MHTYAYHSTPYVTGRECSGLSDVAVPARYPSSSVISFPYAEVRSNNALTFTLGGDGEDRPGIVRTSRREGAFTFMRCLGWPEMNASKDPFALPTLSLLESRPAALHHGMTYHTLKLHLLNQVDNSSIASIQKKNGKTNKGR